MKAKELRELSQEEISSKLLNLEENIFRLRCNKVVGQLTDTSVLKKSRKDIARARTILNEKIRDKV